MSRRALTVVVLLHVAVIVLHATAHDRAAVPTGPLALAFIVVVIQIGPLAGLALSWARPAAGIAVVAATMAGALVFGLVNHFVIDGSDHVRHVAATWRALFATTAVLLAVTEAAGVVLAARWLARRSRTEPVSFS